jgi:hypothetical protein
MKPDEKWLIENDKDYIHCQRLGNSVTKLLDKYPNGVDDKYISKVLLIDIDEIERIYQEAIDKIKDYLDV